MNANPARCLHLVAGSGPSCLRQALAHAAPGDSLLFIDAGVLHLLRAAGGESVPDGVETAFLAADLDAQGLRRAAERAGVRVLPDAALAGLLGEHRLCLSWT